MFARSDQRCASVQLRSVGFAVGTCTMPHAQGTELCRRGQRGNECPSPFLPCRYLPRTASRRKHPRQMKSRGAAASERTRSAQALCARARCRAQAAGPRRLHGARQTISSPRHANSRTSSVASVARGRTRVARGHCAAHTECSALVGAPSATAAAPSVAPASGAAAPHDGSSLHPPPAIRRALPSIGRSGIVRSRCASRAALVGALLLRALVPSFEHPLSSWDKALR